MCTSLDTMGKNNKSRWNICKICVYRIFFQICFSSSNECVFFCLRTVQGVPGQYGFYCAIPGMMRIENSTKKYEFPIQCDFLTKINTFYSKFTFKLDCCLGKNGKENVDNSSNF